jgi:hypothetical protein
MPSADKRPRAAKRVKPDHATWSASCFEQTMLVNGKKGTRYAVCKKVTLILSEVEELN